jgi:hypothetical protein
MASKRRGGLRPPELRGTLGTLLRTTTDVVRDVLERGAREGRARLDDVRAGRRRQDALAELGELVLDLIRRGEIDLEELPEARDLVRQLDDHDAEAGDGGPTPLRASARHRFDDRDATRPAGRDDRPEGSPSRHGDPTADSPRRNARDDSRRRSLAEEATLDERPVHRRPAADDGTVSSGAALRSTRPTTPARPHDAADTSRAPTKPIKGLVRPNVGLVRPEVDGPGEDDDAFSPFGSPSSSASSGSSGSGGPSSASGGPSSGSGGLASASGSASPSGSFGPSRSGGPSSSAGSGNSSGSFGSSSPFDSASSLGSSAPAPRRLQLAPDPHRKGGISFDDDDLDEYMHPDDVPPRSPLPTPSHDPDDRDP